MSEESIDAWFYTAKGERIGPVSIGRLRELADEKKLNPRFDLCWTKGMDEWLPAGQIDGLFDKTRADEGEKSQLSEQAPPRKQYDTSKLSESELELELLNSKWPGASRRVYLFAIWMLPLLVGGAFALFSRYIINSEDPDSAALVPMITGVGGLLFLLLILVISLQRFKNLGMSRWWFLGNFVPVLNLWIGYRTVCCPAGFEFHRKLDGIGVFLAILYWGAIVLSLILIALASITMLGLVSGGMFGEFDALLETWMEKLAELDEEATPAEE